MQDGSGIETEQSMPRFENDVKGASDEELAKLRDDLNKRKDYDYSQHGGKPGPHSKWLWKRIQAIEAEQAWRRGGVLERIARHMLDPFKWLFRGIFDTLVKRLLWALFGGVIVGLAAWLLSNPIGWVILIAILAFLIIWIILEIVRWLRSGRREKTSWVPFGALAAAAMIGMATANLADGEADRATAKSPAPVVDPLPVPAVEPCEVTTGVSFWDPRTNFEFIPAAAPSGETVTVVVTTDAEGAAVFAADAVNFRVRVAGDDFGPGAFEGNRMVFEGRLPPGAAGAVPVELAHGDFVFAEANGGCLTRTP